MIALTNTIDTSLLYSSYLENKKSETTNSLGKDAFLKLLLAQLQNQDPLKPMEETEFISQMATFTSLEQMMALNETVESYLPILNENKLISYSHFLGKEVAWTKIDYVKDGDSVKPVISNGSGTIIAISYKENGPVFRLEDGTELTPEEISEVQTSVEETIVQASFMIGKKVTWLDENGGEHSSIVQSVSQKEGKLLFYLKDHSTGITQDQIKSVEEVSLP